MTILELLIIASGLTATTYGVHGEMYCGDIGKPRPCEYGAITASGDIFDPAEVTAAVAAPTRLRMKPVYVWLRVEGGECHQVRVNDKMNPRYLGVRGFDLTPATVQLLTGKPATRHWSGKVFVCAVPYSLVVK